MKFEPVPTLVRGVLYPSQKAAAEALGVHYTTIHKALEDGRLDRVGLKPRGIGISKKVVIDGVEYRSIRQAAKATGLSKERIGKIAKGIDGGLVNL